MVAAVPPPAGDLVRLGVVPGSATSEQRRLARMADLAGVDVVWAADEPRRPSCAGWSSGRRCSCGPPRTSRGPARSRLDRTHAGRGRRAGRLDPTLPEFGDPGRDGLYGTLADCQARVVELAHAGVVDLRCVVPDVPDVHDLVAQLTAVVVGGPETHRPDAPRSSDPEPPP